MASTAFFPRRQQKQRKVLLMGKSGAGKSSMRSIVFSNYVARDVRRLGATIDIEHSHIKFMGNLMLNLWDCGGQDGFLDNYIHRQRSHVFDSVTVLIFVFDVNSFDQQVDLANYQNIMQALSECSPTAKIFILIHKMDLVPIPKREARLNFLVQTIRNATLSQFEGSLVFFGTSIWDQTLYKAWTAIIYSLIPNVVEIENKLRALATAINARELILYERTTCLMVTHVSQGLERHNPFSDRFERISSILKTHNLSLLRHQTGSVPDPMLLTGTDSVTGGIKGSALGTGMNSGLGSGGGSAGGPTSGPGTGAGPSASMGTGPGPGTTNANLGELHIKTGRFSFFITRLTENANLAATIPPSEQAFNIARASILEAQPRFAILDFGGSGTAASSAAATTTGTSTNSQHHQKQLQQQRNNPYASSASGGGGGTEDSPGPSASSSAFGGQSGRYSAHSPHKSGAHSRSSRRHQASGLSGARRDRDRD